MYTSRHVDLYIEKMSLDSSVHGNIYIKDGFFVHVRVVGEK